MVYEREKNTHTYISRTANVGAELISIGMWVNEGTPTMIFVLNTINVEYMYEASNVT